MLDYGVFCYLDVEKSGSTFIRQFLRSHVSLPEVRSKKHAGVASLRELGENKFFFISCRDPADTYTSLYRFGVQKKGGLYQRLVSDSRLSTLYDGTPEGFEQWLRYILVPNSRRRISSDYGRRPAELYGLLTHRFLRLSFYRAPARASSFRSQEDVVTAYERERLHRVVIRNESLVEDFIELIRSFLHVHLIDPDAAVAALTPGVTRVNTTNREAVPSETLLTRVAHELIEHREWFYYDVLGYERLAGGSSDVAPADASVAREPCV